MIEVCIFHIITHIHTTKNRENEVRRDEMIFKILYQELPNEVPVRERTKSLYVEADSEREVRQKLVDGNYKINVEFIQALDETHLAFEKQSENFILEKV